VLSVGLDRIFGVPVRILAKAFGRILYRDLLNTFKLHDEITHILPIIVMENSSSSSTIPKKALKRRKLSDFNFIITHAVSEHPDAGNPLLVPPLLDRPNHVNRNEAPINQSSSTNLASQLVGTIAKGLIETENVIHGKNSADDDQDQGNNTGDTINRNLNSLQTNNSEETKESQPSQAGEMEVESKKKVGGHDNYNPLWEKHFRWLRLEKGKMICATCKAHKLPNTSNVFADAGSDNFRKSALKDHGSSIFHEDCLERQVSGDSLKALVKNIERKALSMAHINMIICYMMAKEDLALVKFENVQNSFGFFLQTVLENSYHQKNFVLQSIGTAAKNLLSNSYITQYGVREYLKAISSYIFDDQKQRLRNARCYSLMLDEGTDISNQKNIIIYCRYMNHGTNLLHVEYLTLLEVEKTDAIGIYDTLKRFLDQNDISLNRLICVSTDGAAVFRGVHAGVVQKLGASSNLIFSTHCINHVLALSIAKAFAADALLVYYDGIFSKLYGLFSHSSSNEAELRRRQEDNDEVRIKLKKFIDIRWLSRFQAVESVLCSYISIYEVVETMLSKTAFKDKILLAIKDEMEDFKFCALQFILLRVLERLNKTQIFFQKEELLIFGVYDGLARLKTELKLIDDDLIKVLESNDIQKLSSFGSYKVSLSKVLFHPKLCKVLEPKDEEIANAINPIRRLIKGINQNINDYTKDYKFLNNLDVFNLAKICAIGIIGYDTKKKAKVDYKVLNGYGWDKVLDIYNFYRQKGLFPDLLNVDERELHDRWEELKVLVVEEFEHFLPDQLKIWRFFSVTAPYNDLFRPLIALAYSAFTVSPHSADCERGFSKMNIIKSKLRNRLGKHALILYL
jgi:hypothetical protein